MKAKTLIIVESPTKARTIREILGKDFAIEASLGHIKDLPEGELGVDIKGGFLPKYEIIKGKEKILKRLKRLASSSSTVLLATDPDREGEAIAWHIAEEIGRGKDLKRVLIHEITPQGIKEAMAHPMGLRETLFRAQQARRILDRLVGYQISPLLWRKLKGGLSAGRVQSIALRLIWEREREIEEFKPQEYWTLSVLLEHPQKPPAFKAQLRARRGSKLRIRTEREAQEILMALREQRFVVKTVKRKQKGKTPPPPFTTSTLQQEASKRLGFSVKETMAIAQRLYEGVDLGPLGKRGLITYMRTDSVRISPRAVEAARAFIQARYGPKYLPLRPHNFRSGRAAQEAHEAIRPTFMDLPPERVRPYLKAKAYSLYKLIWDRFLASQMAQAQLESTTIEISAGDYLLSASGLVVKFPGFMVIWDAERVKSEELAGLTEGDELIPRDFIPKRNFTQPPPRYTESSLVRELEIRGIGRPSTYATIISTLLDRGYAVLKDRKFHLTELGRTVVELLIRYFPEIMDVKFTARMEEDLDRVEEGKVSWQEVLRGFYESFRRELRKAISEMFGDETLCELCGSPMVPRRGRYGEFLACSSFPRCKNAKPLKRNRR